MTETSPSSFTTNTTDDINHKLLTVGTVLPHTSAKIVDIAGKTVLRGTRGELCIAGYALQKGYYKNKAKTDEVMTWEDGVRWMHTGDEAVMDSEGYCSITGRIKDIIIRGKLVLRCHSLIKANSI
jgi:long-chain acyl-CoA synthetase